MHVRTVRGPKAHTFLIARAWDGRRALDRLGLSADEREGRLDQLNAPCGASRIASSTACLVGLLHSPEQIPGARGQVSPRDFLTPAYAVLAAIILESAPKVLEVMLFGCARNRWKARKVPHCVSGGRLPASSWRPHGPPRLS
jgi:hypothetical protein